ncbi:hypothetical protein C2S51_027713 [Perilla frutescens var. frutescens]|nr:hypothetical protein C2S51_027713 [Perilla frutescens var. frutescens]
MKHHHKHERHLHRQPDAYELYELEHMPHKLTKARSGRARAQARQIFTSDDYYETEKEVEPLWPPTEGGNGVILTPDCYESRRDMQPLYWRSPENDEGGCNGNVDCEAEKFIMLEHKKFELSKWKSSMRK